MPKSVNTTRSRKSRVGMSRAAKPRAVKSDAMLNDCIYQIAAGSWSPARKLPPLREAKERWGVTEVTCFRVYRKLVEDGLVVTRDRDGYYVAENESVARLGGRQDEFRELFEWFEQGLKRRAAEGAFSTIGAARAILQMAEARASQNPECAFVECTQFQAEGHAAEVQERLQIPCATMTTDDLARRRVPPSIRFLLTTPFHLTEVKRAAAKLGAKALAVPVEIDTALLQSIHQSKAGEWVVFGLKTGLAQSVVADLDSRLGSRVGSKAKRLSAKASTMKTLKFDLENVLESSAKTKKAAVLSPSLWAGASAEWRERADVRPLQYRIVPSAWREVAQMLGLPSAMNAGVSEEWPVMGHG